MKQTIMILALMLTAGICGAQTSKTRLQHNDPALNPNQETVGVKNNYVYKLNSFISDDFVESDYYHYDANHRLISVFESVVGDYEVDDSLYYNNQNQIVRLSGFQHLGTEWRNVYYVDYTYDAQGNVATRKNYNNFGGTFQLGGTYSYTYNSQNQIVQTTLDMSGTIYQRIDYAYENGLLKTETWYSYDGSGLAADEQFIYTYTNGKVTNITDKVSDNGGSTWSTQSYQNFSYDNNGNCTEDHTFTSANLEVDRKLYEYDLSRPLEQTLMPWHPELTRPKTYTNANVTTLQHWYAADEDMVLQYVCDYNYNYIGINETGIRNTLKSNVKTYPNPAKNILNIKTDSDSEGMAELLDMSGRQMKSQKINGGKGTMDVSSFAPGFYLLRLTVDGASTTQRVIVR